MKYYDRIIIGAGIYGLFAGIYSAKKGIKTLILEKEAAAFTRATYVNQARVHMGYHYPRSYSTAKKSANYFYRFVQDYPECIHDSFDQIYATSKEFSWTNAKQFQKFCNDAKIKCIPVNTENYFKSNLCDGAFLTEEYTYDAMILKDILLKQASKLSNLDIKYQSNILNITKKNDVYIFDTNQENYSTKFVLNATYASVNQILDMLGYEKFKIKYELCEIILCEPNDKLKNIGLTVMDGPFFSIMPFGKTGYHSLTSVTFTPHKEWHGEYPKFNCQKNIDSEYCNLKKLGNCDGCVRHPDSAWVYMYNLAKKYLNDDLKFKYKKSLFSMKPILESSEIDDSRPTVIRKHSEDPTFYSVLSGKINTVYDLEDIL